MSFGRIIGGELKSGDDCGELRWVGQDEFATLETTPINKQVFALLATPASTARTDGTGMTSEKLCEIGRMISNAVNPETEAIRLLGHLCQ